MKQFSLAIALLLVSAGVCLVQTEMKTATASAAKRPQTSKAQLQKHLSAIERGFWEGWAKGDVTPFKANIAADAIMVTDTGTQDKEMILKAIAAGACEVRSFDLSDFKMVSLGATAAVLMYKATQDATCGGEVLPKTVWVSTVYARRGAKWFAVAHQETTGR